MATSIIKTNELRLLNDQVVMSDGALTENVTFPAGHIIEVKTVNHTSSSGDTFGVAFGTALTLYNILTTEKLIIICGGGWAKFANGAYKRRTRTHVQVDYDGTTTLIKGGYAANHGSWVDESGAPGFCVGIWENNTGSTISVLSLKSYAQGDSVVNSYCNWDSNSDYPITIVAMRCVNA